MHVIYACHAAFAAGSVRFAEEHRPPSPRPAAAALPQRLDVRLGLLLVGGIYATNLLQLEGSTAEQKVQQEGRQQQQPEVHGLAASNLSVGVEPAGGGGTRLVLRLWAEREGPFEADFTLVLERGQKVCRAIWQGSRRAAGSTQVWRRLASHTEVLPAPAHLPLPAARVLPPVTADRGARRRHCVLPQERHAWAQAARAVPGLLRRRRHRGCQRLAGL